MQGMWTEKLQAGAASKFRIGLLNVWVHIRSDFISIVMVMNEFMSDNDLRGSLREIMAASNASHLCSKATT